LPHITATGIDNIAIRSNIKYIESHRCEAVTTAFLQAPYGETCYLAGVDGLAVSTEINMAHGTLEVLVADTLAAVSTLLAVPLLIIRSLGEDSSFARGVRASGMRACSLLQNAGVLVCHEHSTGSFLESLRRGLHLRDSSLDVGLRDFDDDGDDELGSGFRFDEATGDATDDNLYELSVDTEDLGHVDLERVLFRGIEVSGVDSHFEFDLFRAVQLAVLASLTVERVRESTLSVAAIGLGPVAAAISFTADHTHASFRATVVLVFNVFGKWSSWFEAEHRARAADTARRVALGSERKCVLFGAASRRVPMATAVSFTTDNTVASMVAIVFFRVDAIGGKEPRPAERRRLVLDA